MGESAVPGASSAYELITMGRIGMDLYPLRTGVPLPQVTSAIVASRLECSSAMPTPSEAEDALKEGAVL
ncbi:hypothetical protein [Streptomyces yerevanensis]|uniref:hypothetical protein n=1 Tax=Streptomyces yerevanensis TaxID=66378 RepID=UPI0005251C8E